jgi:pimeloyl-ACP methyl ester carboxylesterase
MKNYLSFLFFASISMSALSQTDYDLLLDSVSKTYEAKNYQQSVALFSQLFKMKKPDNGSYLPVYAAESAFMTGKWQQAFDFLDVALRSGLLQKEAYLQNDAIQQLKTQHPVEWDKFEKSVQDAITLYKNNLNPGLYNLAQNTTFRKLQQYSTAEDLYKALKNWNKYPAITHEPQKLLYFNQIANNTKAPYLVMVPPGYQSNRPHKLLVYLHGGVYSLPDFLPVEAKQEMFDQPVIDEALRRDFVVLYPYGCKKAGWYDTVGMKNVLDQIARVKQLFNIDDDGVYMMGFSNGGAGCFAFAMEAPGPFAKFYSLNAVPPLSKRIFYPDNIAARSIYSVNTTGDERFHIAAVKSLEQLATQLALPWKEVVYPDIPHNYYPYIDNEKQTIFADMQAVKRNPLQQSLHWKTADLSFTSGCDWLVINKTDSTLSGSVTTNTIRFYDSIASKADSIKAGQEGYEAKASYLNNSFDIQSKGIRQLSILIHPDMVNLNRPVKVIVNGKTCYNKQVAMNRNFLLQQFMHHYDRKSLWVNAITIEVP